ncbi:hypothetical protein JW948_04905 [bacterium]|nr:hypothetical protein [bacterium]
MKKSAFIFCIMGLSLCLFRCAGVFPGSGPLPETAPGELMRRITRHTDKLSTIQGHAQLLVNSEMGNFYGTLEVKAHLPDSMLAKVEGPFGVDMALMRLCSEDVLFYSPYLHLAFEGSLRDTLRDFLPFHMNTADFLLQALGLMKMNAEHLKDMSLFYTKDGQYVYGFQNGERIWVHPKGPVITRWEKKDETGKPIWTWEGSRFKKSGGIRMPQTIQITTEEPRQKVTVYYTKRKTNQELNTGWCTLKIPESVNPLPL